MNSTLEECCEFVLDGTHGSPVKTESGVPVLSAQNVRDGILDYATNRFTTEQEYQAFKRRLDVRPDDVLLTIVGTIGRVAVVTESRPLVFQRSVAVLRPKTSKTNPRYLFHSLQQHGVRSQLARSTNQSSQAGVYLGKLKKVQIPLPPLDEQTRIAEVLDKADALRQKRRLAIQKLDTLLQSVFLDMFGDPIANPKGWDVVPLMAVTEEFRYGTSNKSGDTGFATLRIPNVVRESIDLSDLKTVDVSPDEFERLRLRDGDVLFVRTNGNPNFVGRTAVFSSGAVDDSPFNSDEFIYASYLIRARLHQGRLVPRYLQYFLMTQGGRKQLRSKSKTSAGQFNINTEGLGKLEICLPPLSKQEQFERVVAESERLRRRLEEQKEQTDLLFGSLQQRAFRGELSQVAEQ